MGRIEHVVIPLTHINELSTANLIKLHRWMCFGVAVAALDEQFAVSYAEEHLSASEHRRELLHMINTQVALDYSAAREPVRYSAGKYVINIRDDVATPFSVEDSNIRRMNVRISVARMVKCSSIKMTLWWNMDEGVSVKCWGSIQNQHGHYIRSGEVRNLWACPNDIQAG